MKILKIKLQFEQTNKYEKSNSAPYFTKLCYSTKYTKLNPKIWPEYTSLLFIEM
jgi:hypothetical protein